MLLTTGVDINIADKSATAVIGAAQSHPLIRVKPARPTKSRDVLSVLCRDAWGSLPNCGLRAAVRTEKRIQIAGTSKKIVRKINSEVTSRKRNKDMAPIPILGPKSHSGKSDWCSSDGARSLIGIKPQTPIPAQIASEAIDWGIVNPVIAIQKKTANRTANNSEEFVSFNEPIDSVALPLRGNTILRLTLAAER